MCWERGFLQKGVPVLLSAAIATWADGHTLCTHIGDHESAAMWELYGQRGGIAVCSRISKLKGAIPAEYDTGSWGLYGNAVRYVDFDSYDEPFMNAATSQPIIRASELHLKRLSFEHEREYRLTTTLDGADEHRIGKHVPLCLATMIEEIRVSPTAQDWMVEAIACELKQYGLDVRVTKSGLYDAVLQ
jgi:hypothetical protein